MNNRTKYCRYRNYILQVQNEKRDNINVVTSDWETGISLNLICHDRDHFTAEIPKIETDCIWTIESNGNFYDTIQVEFGNIKIGEFENQFDLLNSEFIVNGEFAKYQDKIFRSLSGYGHNYWFKLFSIDGLTQDIGFIMERPGKFYKCVNPNEIEFGFISQTFCNYKEKEFCVINSNQSEQILIEPYDSNLYVEIELLDIGFEYINTKLAKWIMPTQAEKIWIKTHKIHDFDRFLNNDKILYEK